MRFGCFRVAEIAVLDANMIGNPDAVSFWRKGKRNSVALRQHFVGQLYPDFRKAACIEKQRFTALFLVS